MSKANYFIKGLPELLVHQLLAREELYGYQLVARIQISSREVLNFREGCIYPILHRMVEDGYLLERREVVSGRPRVYYRASAKGKKRAEQLQQEWNTVVTAVETVMEVTHA